jgi:multiple sugar transport system ATP-binding protein
LSGGQRQRVALGRAIVREPKVFLMDEPLSNLDAKLRGEMRAEILKLHRTIKNTIIYVTHDQVEAMTMGDRIVVLNAGYVQQADTPNQIYNFPNNKFVAGFMGSPPMNFLTVTITQKEQDIILSGQGVEKFEIVLPEQKITDEIKSLIDKKAILGIRPEDVFDYTNPKVRNFESSFIKGLVDIVEPLGSELYVHMTVGNENMIGRLEPNVQIKPSEQFKAFIDPEKIHLFHPETENRISL